MQQLILTSMARPHGNWSPFDIPTDISTSGYHVGTSGYHFDDWIGRFNPPKANKRQIVELTESQREDHDLL